MRVRLSGNQMRILLLLGESPSGAFSRRTVRLALYGHGNLSASDRSSFSRSLASLLNGGFVRICGQSDRVKIRLTPAGRDAIAVIG